SLKQLTTSGNAVNAKAALLALPLDTVSLPEPEPQPSPPGATEDTPTGTNPKITYREFSLTPNKSKRSKALIKARAVIGPLSNIRGALLQVQTIKGKVKKALKLSPTAVADGYGEFSASFRFKGLSKNRTRTSKYLVRLIITASDDKNYQLKLGEVTFGKTKKKKGP
ncbi:MAG: hypothetical protein KDD62_10170, partial [Bdellovibrionales bacterium]|nr:hypothetical protein [Bdellovibrionales bacterium]